MPKAATILNDNETELNSVVTLDNIAKTLYTNSAFLITVRVVQSTRGIAGTYVCRATSSAGSRERELIIRVKGNLHVLEQYCTQIAVLFLKSLQLHLARQHIGILGVLSMAHLVQLLLLRNQLLFQFMRQL